jgi:hypothetical protein
MTYPDLPISVKIGLATEQMRASHHMWHLVRSQAFWNSISAQDQANLTSAGWRAPRFVGTSGGGIDFLGMHRQMIPHVDHLMAQAGDPAWQNVTEWHPFPWNETDADWPMPPTWPGIDADIAQAKLPQSVPQMQQVAAQLIDPVILRQVTVDRLGTYIEFSIHGWMHYRWSAAPPTADAFALDPANDWLGAPWSSHVNKHFWKLHGWIDARIGDWERANDQQADLSAAWSGPAHHMLHSTTEAVQPQLRSEAFRFRIDQDVIADLLSIRRG